MEHDLRIGRRQLGAQPRGVANVGDDRGFPRMRPGLDDVPEAGQRRRGERMPVSFAPSPRSQSHSHDPLKPVWPVRKTRLPRQKVGISARPTANRILSARSEGPTRGRPSRPPMRT